jgi:hypothetical protein
MATFDRGAASERDGHQTGDLKRRSAPDRMRSNQPGEGQDRTPEEYRDDSASRAAPEAPANSGGPGGELLTEK